MRKAISRITVSACALAAFAFSACGASYDRTTFVLHKDGTAKQYIIDDAYSDTAISELRDYIDTSIEQYSGGSEEEKIKLEKCDIAGGKIDVELSYASCADYAAYNDVVCFGGTLEEAVAAGYDLEQEYTGNEGESLTYSGILALETEKELRVLIMNEVTAVELPGTLIAYSSNVQPDEKGRLSAVPNTDESVPEEFRTVNFENAYFVYAL